MAESKMTPNAKPAPESYDEKFDRMKRRKEEREAVTTELTPIEKLKQQMKAASGPRDWPEDFDGENGTYSNMCVYCKHEFMGHKRRVVCKWCRPRGAGGQVIA